MRTVVVAAAGLDHHDTLGEGFSIIAAETDLDSPGLLGSTAPAIHARPTVLGAVLLHTGASSISKPYRGWGLLSLGTFFSLLQGGVAGLATRPHFAYPGLFDELAVGIVVGDSGGDAGPTRL